MRFIIHEQAYEIPLASGMWRYFHDGRPTGAVEKWRLSDAVDGYRFLRVDLDARSAQSGRSYLYHLTLNQDGIPIQLKFRFWEDEFEIIGTVLLEEDSIIVTKEIKGERFEEILLLPKDYRFWFPASTGLGLLAKSPAKNIETAVSLQTNSNLPEKLMSPYVTPLQITRGDYTDLEIMNKQTMVCPLTIRWQGQQRKIWINKNNWPLMMERPDGLSAKESQYIQYQRISKPRSKSNEKQA